MEMVAAKAKLLPESKALSVRLGLALFALGTLIAFWSFSGKQAYDIKFFYLAIAATLLALYGAVLLANSRVVSDRQRRIARARRSEATTPSAPSGKPRASVGPPSGEIIRLLCPTCATPFEAQGVRPFSAVCPHCGAKGTIGEPAERRA